MQRKKQCAALRILCAAFALCMLLSGCSMAGTEDFYTLPRLSDASLQLEELISERIAAGYEYAAPTEGSRRQSVQMQDLTGSGDNEAVVFLADEDRSPAVCVYSRDGAQDYYLYVVIRGEGSSVCAVDYSDLTGDGAKELIITWQVGGDIRLLTVYSLSSGSPEQLFSADCTAFAAADLTGDGKDDLINLRADSGTVDCCSFSLDGGCISCSAPLSQGITKVSRMRVGTLSDGAQAVFLESTLSDGTLITDVMTAPGGVLTNITLTEDGRSDTVRPSPAYAEDINGDGHLELPEQAGDTLVWYVLDSHGNRADVLTTYHNYEDGWYLVLTGIDTSRLTVETGSVVAGSDYASFLMTGDDGSRTEVLAIYTLTGENRLDRAALEGRFVLAEAESVIYAAVLKTDSRTQDDIINSFNLICTQWQTGEL